MIHVTYYTLTRQDGTKAFEAEYCQYFAEYYPYIALYESYPSQGTRILICKKTDEDRPDALNLANTEKVFMKVLVVQEVRSPFAALEWVKNEYRGRNPV